MTHHTPDPNAPEVPTGEEIPLNDPLSSFHPDDAPAMRKLLQGVFEGSLSSFAYTARRITSRGTVLVSAYVEVVRDESGRAVEASRGGRITPLDARGSSTGAAAVGLWSRNIRTGEMWLDEGCKTIYGLTGDEPDMRLAMIARNHPEDQIIASSYISEMIASGQSSARRTFRLRADDGTYRWASADICIESGDENGPARSRGNRNCVYPTE